MQVEAEGINFNLEEHFFCFQSAAVLLTRNSSRAAQHLDNIIIQILFRQETSCIRSDFIKAISDNPPKTFEKIEYVLYLICLHK